jgi:hypothetical protein
VDVSLSDGGAGSFATLKRRDSRGRAVALGLGVGRALPAPALAGDTATYDSAVPGADLTATVGRDTFSHSFVIDRQSSAAASYRIPLTVSGLSVRMTASGGLEAVDGAGKVAFQAPPPRMWDSSVDPRAGESTHVAPVKASVDNSGSVPVLVLTPDAKFLADPATVYPVTVDPTWTGSSPTDTWVQYNDYLSSQAGSDQLKAGTYNGSEKARSFLKFTLSSKLTGAKITDAKLRLHNFYSGSCTGGAIAVRRITETGGRRA